MSARRIDITLKNTRGRGYVRRIVEIDDPFGTSVRLVGAPKLIDPSEGLSREPDGDDANCLGCGKIRSDIKGLATGATAVGKLIGDKDQASPQDVRQRIETCRSCPSGCFDGFGICDESKGGCGCLLAVKVRIASESCPHEHWPSVQSK